MRFFSIIAAITTTFVLCNSNTVYAVSTPTAADIKTMTARRIANILDIGSTSEENINTWKNTLKSSGTWSGIDYTAGCNARVANWPATQHLSRTRSLASAYILDPSDTVLLNKTISALNYWFKNDFVPNDCIDKGGVKGKKCPCGTPGLWNKNWFNQIISVPDSIGDICLLLKSSLDASQRGKCTQIQARAFAKVSKQTGANLLDVSSIGITLGLLNEDPNILKKALDEFYAGVFINPVTAGDGIQSDGSFMMHKGLIYNGNYGKDFINDLLAVFIETKETNLAPPPQAQLAFENLMSGSEWMIMADAKLNHLLWQYSVIGRMISFKYSDGQASSGIAIDLEKIDEGTQGWAIQKDMNAITDRLKAPHTIDANQGDLVGTRYFYNADYMVHRAPTYITSMKMYSTRTINGECINQQNKLGFHLSDGALFNYLSGDEYVDVFGSWNWELVPGTTVDIGGTPLICGSSKNKGLKSFVGGATDGNTGIAVMDFQNPINKNLSFKKTAFFFPSVYAIQLGPVTSKNKNAQLVTVLDQRKRNGDIYVAGKVRNTDSTYATPKTNSIWHDKIGYYFPSAETLYVDSKPRAAKWADIGISNGNEIQQLWTSYIKHGNTTSTTGLLTQYVVQPNIDQSTFQSNINNGKIPIALAHRESNPQVNAAYSAADDTIATAFWTAGTYATPWRFTTITVDKPCVTLLRRTKLRTYRLTVADPSQTLKSIKLTVKIGLIRRSVTFTLPTGSDAGKAVFKTIII